jgi:plastocyanin
VRLRRRYLPLAVVLGAAAAVLPAIAASETNQTVTAENLGGGYVGEEHRWTPPQVTVNAGGGVTFSNPTEVKHGIHWINPPSAPSCDSSVPVGASETAAGTKWSGTCTFAQSGTYTYYCTVHGAAMSGTITVNPGGTTTVTTGTTPTGTTTAPKPEAPSGSPLVGEPSLRSSQHGASVRGSLDISTAGAGDRLEVDLFASGASLATTRHSTRVRVGRFVRGSTPAGRQSFAVTLSAKAKRALKRHRRLALTVRIVLAPVYGETTTLTRAVVLHP